MQNVRSGAIVVPLAGTWIEIAIKMQAVPGIQVVPLAGTWIEITSYTHYIVER